MRLKSYLLIGFILVTLFILLAAAILKNRPQPVVPQQAVGNEMPSLKGVSISPKSFTGSDFGPFWAEASSIGNAITWAGSIDEVNRKDGAPYIMTQLAVQNKLEPIMVFQVFDRSTNKLFAALEEGKKEETITALKNFVKDSKIKYVAIGIEVNMLYEETPAEFNRYVSVFNEISAAIKDSSPETKIFPTFQFERLQGLRGGLFGGKIEPEKNDWKLLSQFENADFIGFTTYPGLIYPSPELIPDDYYTAIAKQTKKPVVFTEVGWSHATVAKGWESSPQAQKNFITRFKSDMQKLNVKLIIWSFLYDQDVPVPFKYMGLRNPNDAQMTESELEWAK